MPCRAQAAVMAADKVSRGADLRGQYFARPADSHHQGSPGERLTLFRPHGRTPYGDPSDAALGLR